MGGIHNNAISGVDIFFQFSYHNVGKLIRSTVDRYHSQFLQSLHSSNVPFLVCTVSIRYFRLDDPWVFWVQCLHLFTVDGEGM